MYVLSNCKTAILGCFFVSLGVSLQKTLKKSVFNFYRWQMFFKGITSKSLDRGHYTAQSNWNCNRVKTTHISFFQTDLFFLPSCEFLFNCSHATDVSIKLVCIVVYWKVRKNKVFYSCCFWAKRNWRINRNRCFP